MKCKECGVDNKIGAIMCEACGEPLEVSIGSAAPNVSGPNPTSLKKIVPTAQTRTQVFRLVEGGKTSDKEFELPPDDFEFMLGRTDLDEGIIPDVDLAKFGEKVTIEGKVGYTFSRKQATLSRRMGKLYVKAIGSAKTMHFSVATKAWVRVAQNEEVEIAVGDRMRFGGSEGYVMFEVVEQ